MSSGLDCGVSQGSCLGDLLFVIYINDLPFALQSRQVTMYADYTILSNSTKNITDLNEILIRDLCHIMQGRMETLLFSDGMDFLKHASL